LDELLKISNLHVIYKTDEKTVYAVNGLNLTLRKGETFGLVGETGAGKTTTALSILRLLPKRNGFIKQGLIELEDLKITELTEADMRPIRGKSISMIFQDPMTSLNPIITVGQQMAEVLELHKKGMSKQQISERVDKIMNLVGLLAQRRGEYPHQFSGGMKQRVMIAMALACEPKLLIADEPTTALDVTIQAQILDLMRDLKEEINTAMLLITHDLGVVAQICDKVAIMYAGEIVEVGTDRDIFKSEDHHPYTQGLFDAIPNLSTETKRLKTIGGLMPDPTNLPKGCKFHPRCPKCMEICKTIIPENIISGTHTIKCHLYQK